MILLFNQKCCFLKLELQKIFPCSNNSKFNDITHALIYLKRSVHFKQSGKNKLAFKTCWLSWNTNLPQLLKYFCFSAWPCTKALESRVFTNNNLLLRSSVFSFLVTSHISRSALRIKVEGEWWRLIQKPPRSQIPWWKFEGIEGNGMKTPLISFSLSPLQRTFF